MTTIYAKNSLDWVLSTGVHIKSDKLARNGLIQGIEDPELNIHGKAIYINT